MNTAYRAWMATTEGKAPHFREMVFSGIEVDGAGHAARLRGLPEAPIQKLRLSGIRMAAQEGLRAERVEDMVLEDVSIGTQGGPACRWTACQGLRIDGELHSETGQLNRMDSATISISP